MDIKGKTAVVTGAATGIGRATSLALAEADVSAIALADIDAEKMQQTAAEIERLGTRTLCIPTDVTDIDALEGMFAKAADELGGFDIVFNNAGIVSGEPIWPETPVRKIAQVAQINLIGIVAGTRIAIDHLSRRGGGAIVNTGSIA
ncbi:MAG: SDR family NAD(P)-dependent oxidoreductase, partial [Gammaproteobacteria bacterium]|nr:SDR family NAD(P)-dependent oxidoreductase [Gammaproteobacteria bacterium]